MSHEPQGLKPHGLHLNRVPAAAGVVRHHREHDISPIRDIESSIHISKARMTTQHTTESCLSGPAALVAAAADAAGSAGVAWINQEYRHAPKRCFIADKLPQLPEGPIALPCALRLPNRYPKANMRQLFQRHSPRGAFGFRNKSFADNVVCMRLKAVLPAAEGLQSPLGASCANRLKRGAASSVPLAAVFNRCAAERFAIAIRGKVDDAKIDTQNAINLIRCRFVNNTDRKQVPPALSVDQIAFTLPRLQQEHLALTGNKWNGLATIDCPDRSGLFLRPKGENAIIVGNAAVLGVAVLCLAIQFVAISNFSKAPNNQLSRQARVSLDTVVDHLLKIVLAKGLRLPRHAADLVTRGIRLFKGATQRIRLFRRWKEFDLGYNLHLVSIPNGDGTCKTTRSGIGCPLGAQPINGRGFLPTLL